MHFRVLGVCGGGLSLRLVVVALVLVLSSSEELRSSASPLSLASTVIPPGGRLGKAEQKGEAVVQTGSSSSSSKRENEPVGAAELGVRFQKDLSSVIDALDEVLAVLDEEADKAENRSKDTQKACESGQSSLKARLHSSVVEAAPEGDVEEAARTRAALEYAIKEQEQISSDSAQSLEEVLQQRGKAAEEYNEDRAESLAALSVLSEALFALRGGKSVVPPGPPSFLEVQKRGGRHSVKAEKTAVSTEEGGALRHSLHTVSALWHSLDLPSPSGCKSVLSAIETENGGGEETDSQQKKRKHQHQSSSIASRLVRLTHCLTSALSIASASSSLDPDSLAARDSRVMTVVGILENMKSNLQKETDAAAEKESRAVAAHKVFVGALVKRKEEADATLSKAKAQLEKQKAADLARKEAYDEEAAQRAEDRKALAALAPLCLEEAARDKRRAEERETERCGLSTAKKVLIHLKKREAVEPLAPDVCGLPAPIMRSGKQPALAFAQLSSRSHKAHTNMEKGGDGLILRGGEREDLLASLQGAVGRLREEDADSVRAVSVKRAGKDSPNVSSSFRSSLSLSSVHQQSKTETETETESSSSSSSAAVSDRIDLAMLAPLRKELLQLIASLEEEDAAEGRRREKCSAAVQEAQAVLEEAKDVLADARTEVSTSREALQEGKERRLALEKQLAEGQSAFEKASKVEAERAESAGREKAARQRFAEVLKAAASILTHFLAESEAAETSFLSASASSNVTLTVGGGKLERTPPMSNASSSSSFLENQQGKVEKRRVNEEEGAHSVRTESQRMEAEKEKAHRRTGGLKVAVALLERLQERVELEDAKASKEDARAEAKFRKSLNEWKSAETALKKRVASEVIDAAGVRARISHEREDRREARARVEAARVSLKDTKASCASLLEGDGFDQRREKRSDDVAAFRDAYEVLGGASEGVRTGVGAPTKPPPLIKIRK
uniref:Uncharacterized protein n=1 Tax=Chromera velia CCMP2878 TaxID=1169474 RepID=A0A0G4F820_9ALVE|eukprot:Cvel_15587.t1-p1 / transcript=Cvel_15587.t1 / gene=Cvel_15587 / organism=Chromera_velia_CCMP2878 / gene_product=hypothetical protein / transcript_product=hypothetical protein / location=Cvel_scaffold1159:15934-21036(-) / protein_length=960 / sequence_SO=supercontig / SO=protein_coding / is_pseudo=false